MEVSITDKNGKPINSTQLKHLNLWNTTAEHICASTLQRLKNLEGCDAPLSLEIK